VLIREALQQALTDALRQRDRPVAAAIRTALAAIANAEAVPVPVDLPPTGAVSSPHVAGSAAGLAANEVPRRHLTQDEALAIVAQEHAGLLAHVARLRQQCRPDDADAARRAAATLGSVLAAQRSQR
jgi:hypothetical protein